MLMWYWSATIILIYHASDFFYCILYNILRDLEEEPEPPRPKIRIENLSSTLKGSEEITPPPTIKHCECKNYARTANGELIKCPKPTIFFNDNIRSVDFVLVWDSHSEDATTADSFYKRRIFEENLMNDGLDIEYEDPEQNGLNFIKVIFLHGCMG